MTTLKLNYKTAIFRLCINSKSSGTIVGQRLREPIPFSSLPDLLFKLDYIMDKQDYPRAFQRKRLFEQDSKKYDGLAYAETPEEAMTAEAVDASTGEVITLRLQVITRQNATWQGSVSIVSSSDSERFDFDSDLQLLVIIDRLAI